LPSALARGVPEDAAGISYPSNEVVPLGNHCKRLS
jgi:hypothetical protein